MLTVVLMGCSSLSPSGNSKTFYDIAGVVTDADGHGIENVRLVSDNGNIAYTDAEGRWSMTGLIGTNIITPVLEEWVFEPPEWQVSKASSNVNFTGKEGFTPVQGVIDTDTVWTTAESPYKLTGDIGIATGARLFIEPGVRVYGTERVYSEPKILVRGELHVQGRPDAPVVLDGIDIKWNGSGLIHVEHALIQGGGLATADGMGSSGRFMLRDSVLIDVHRGMYLRHYPASTYIERNVFVRSRGPYIFMSGGKGFDWPEDVKVFIRNNVFYEQLTDDRGAIHIGLNDPNDVVIRYNSFLSTDRIALSGTSIDAAYNFWNTTDPDEIRSMIDGLFSQTNFEPFLADPHPDTPQLPNPIPPPRPIY